MDIQQAVPLLLFSGGLDSSYMLFKALEEGDVETLYVKSSQGYDKIEKELAVRKSIIEQAELLTGNKVREDHIVDIGFILHGGIPNKRGLQPISWVVGAIHVTDHTKHSRLQIGYVKGDDVIADLPDITTLWDSSQRISKLNFIPIYFPLVYHSKRDILDSIPPQIVSRVWICETPERFGADETSSLKACGYCTPCLTMYGHVATWEKAHGRNYSKDVISRLNNLREDVYGEYSKEV